MKTHIDFSQVIALGAQTGMDHLVILPQIEDLLYPLKPEELAHLEASIIAEGVREPLTIWERGGTNILMSWISCSLP